MHETNKKDLPVGLVRLEARSVRAIELTSKSGGQESQIEKRILVRISPISRACPFW